MKSDVVNPERRHFVPDSERCCRAMALLLSGPQRIGTDAPFHEEEHGAA